MSDTPHNHLDQWLADEKAAGRTKWLANPAWK